MVDYLDFRILIPKNSRDKVLYVLLKDTVISGVKIPRGLTTDGASTPRFLWALIPPVHEYLPAAVLHDYLLYIGTPRSDADRKFRDCMLELGVNPLRVKLMYWAVRAYSKIKPT